VHVNSFSGALIATIISMICVSGRVLKISPTKIGIALYPSVFCLLLLSRLSILFCRQGETSKNQSSDYCLNREKEKKPQAANSLEVAGADPGELPASLAATVSSLRSHVDVETCLLR